MSRPRTLRLENLEDRCNPSTFDPLATTLPPAPEAAPMGISLQLIYPSAETKAQARMSCSTNLEQMGLALHSAGSDLAGEQSGPAPAQVDFFLRLEGVDGESTDAVHQDERDLVWMTGDEAGIQVPIKIKHGL
jgi:hypothetical protein